VTKKTLTAKDAKDAKENRRETDRDGKMSHTPSRTHEN